MALEDLPPGSPLDSALNAVLREVERATTRFPAMAGPHEGYAVILEELDELWSEVKDDRQPEDERYQRMRKEAIQVAAMAVRFLIDVAS